MPKRVVEPLLFHSQRGRAGRMWIPKPAPPCFGGNDSLCPNPESAGDCRPITVLSCVYRAWCSARLQVDSFADNCNLSCSDLGQLVPGLELGVKFLGALDLRINASKCVIWSTDPAIRRTLDNFTFSLGRPSHVRDVRELGGHFSFTFATRNSTVQKRLAEATASLERIRKRGAISDTSWPCSARGTPTCSPGLVKTGWESTSQPQRTRCGRGMQEPIHTLPLQFSMMSSPTQHSSYIARGLGISGSTPRTEGA